jgi:hypothetical protein
MIGRTIWRSGGLPICCAVRLVICSLAPIRFISHCRCQALTGHLLVTASHKELALFPKSPIQEGRYPIISHLELSSATQPDAAGRPLLCGSDQATPSKGNTAASRRQAVPPEPPPPSDTGSAHSRPGSRPRRSSATTRCSSCLVLSSAPCLSCLAWASHRVPLPRVSYFAASIRS